MNVSEACIEAMVKRGESPGVARLCNRMAYEVLRDGERALVKQLIPPGLESEVIDLWFRAFEAMDQRKFDRVHKILTVLHQTIGV